MLVIAEKFLGGFPVIYLLNNEPEVYKVYNNLTNAIQATTARL